jgi:putative aldouronate transport system permease protein
MVDRSAGRTIFRIANATFFVLYALICLVPVVQVLAISLSSSSAVVAGKVLLFPVSTTLRSYSYILGRGAFWTAMQVSFLRVALGVTVSMIMTVLAAYPLSLAKHQFRARGFITWLFLIAMLFSGGMIPTYMVVRYTGLIDSIWALVLPCAVQIFNIILMMNFFRNIPPDISESAEIDGAGHFRILLQIYLPLSLPSLATMVVFTMVYHWNSWFDGLLYMNKASNYPMQTYLQAILVQPNVRILTKAAAELLRLISDRTLKAAQVFIAAIPVLIAYPFLQKYFVSGIMLGSVKE